MESQSSRTALLTAAYRAAHQTIDGGRVFSEPLAPRILGPDATEALGVARRDNWLARYQMNHFAARSRFAEEKAEAAIADGVRQISVLGAGYDTFCYRAPGANALRLFEVDHELTQKEKRARLAESGIEPPASLANVGVDFERESLADKPGRAGFDPKAPSFFIWLGVIFYLRPEAAVTTLATLGEFSGPVRIVIDYFTPWDLAAWAALPLEIKQPAEEQFSMLEKWGEPVLNFMSSDAMRDDSNICGFVDVDDLGPPEINARFEIVRPPHMVSPTEGWRFVHARKPMASGNGALRRSKANLSDGG